MDSSILKLYHPIGAAVYVVLILARMAYRRKNPKVNLPDTPILLAYYAAGSPLRAISHGQMGDLYYSVIVASEGNNVIYRVELPYYSDVHLLGISKNAGVSHIRPHYSSKAIEPVVLEGNFPDYFSLYADKQMQSLSRYLMDPTAMVYILDFCRSHSWEIVGNELYFVQESWASRQGDSTRAFDDIPRFVSEIRPAVEKKLTYKQLKGITPYGKDRRDDLQCPVCHEKLTNHQTYFSCPLLHGYLVTGSTLRKIRSAELKLAGSNSSETDVRDKSVTCPSCGNLMKRVDYNHTGIMIDSCTGCHYRWLDRGEANRISLGTQ